VEGKELYRRGGAVVVRERIASEVIYADLQQHCKKMFDMEIYEAIPINKGYLNLKWKIRTNKGTFLLKQYNQERFQTYDWNEVENILNIQQKFYNEGIACPSYLTYEGNIMQTTEQGEKFAVMYYCEGENIEPGKVNMAQMYELGAQTGKIHRLLNEGKEFSSPFFIPPSKEDRMGYWKESYKEAEEWLRPLIKLQIKATEVVDFSLLSQCEIGLAHRDLWVDNMLFSGDKLSAILDFDRLAVDYPELDVARAIMSCSLEDNHFRIGNVQAFLNGYRTEHDFPKRKVVRALWMLLYMEGKWWIHKNMYKIGPAPIRFAKEMTWLAEHCTELGEWFGEM
jgi:homoserine kinase type II